MFLFNSLQNIQHQQKQTQRSRSFSADVNLVKAIPQKLLIRYGLNLQGLINIIIL